MALQPLIQRACRRPVWLWSPRGRLEGESRYSRGDGSLGRTIGRSDYTTQLAGDEINRLAILVPRPFTCSTVWERDYRLWSASFPVYIGKPCTLESKNCAHSRTETRGSRKHERRSEIVRSLAFSHFPEPWLRLGRQRSKWKWNNCADYR